MEKDKVLLEQVKGYIEELKKSRVPRDVIDKCFGLYHEHISRQDIGYEEKIYLCIMNGLAYMKVGSYLSAQDNYSRAKSYGKQIGNKEMLKDIGYEILYFYANSKEWTYEKHGYFLLEMAKK